MLLGGAEAMFCLITVRREHILRDALTQVWYLTYACNNCIDLYPIRYRTPCWRTRDPSKSRCALHLKAKTFVDSPNEESLTQLFSGCWCRRRAERVFPTGHQGLIWPRLRCLREFNEKGFKSSFFIIFSYIYVRRNNTSLLVQPELFRGIFNAIIIKHSILITTVIFQSPDEYRLLGVFLGLALYNNTILDLHFPRLVYKKVQKPRGFLRSWTKQVAAADGRPYYHGWFGRNEPRAGPGLPHNAELRRRRFRWAVRPQLHRH